MLTRRLTITLPESVSRLLERVKLQYQGRRHLDSVALYALQYGLRAFELDPMLFFAEQAIQPKDPQPNDTDEAKEVDELAELGKLLEN